MKLKIIVGLGNPGLEYQKTRHNLGFEIIEALATKLTLSFTKKKLEGLYCHGKYKNCNFILLQPLTFMNNSGECVKKFVDYFQVSQEDILVIYDDLDLPLRTFRYRLQGTSGGHNGIKSIINSLQTEKIKRLRVGIGCDKKFLWKQWVLQKFSTQEWKNYEKLIPEILDSLLWWIESDNFDLVMNRFNKKTL